MALTINNIWGAETGGVEELYAISSSVSASTVQVHSGKYSYLQTSGSNPAELYPFESVADAGSGYIFGGWVFIEGSVDTANTIFNFTEAGVSIFRLRGDGPAGQLAIVDANGTEVGTSSGAVLTADTWHFIEIYLEHSASGDVEVFVDGVSVISEATIDTTNGGTFDEVAIRGLADTQGTYFDDMYFMSGATASSDRLGGCEVYAYWSSLASATAEHHSSGVLQTGEWADAQEMPFGDTNIAAFTDTIARWGVVNTDDLGTPPEEVQTDTVGNHANSRGTYLSPDGKELYIIDLTNNALYHTSMTADADLSTRSVTDNLSVGGQDGNMLGVFWRNSTEFYLMGDGSGDTVYKYTTTTAWELGASASYSGVSHALGALTVPTGLYFSTDGTKMFVGGFSMIRWTLSTAWDITSATKDTGQSLNAGQNASDLCFSADGKLVTMTTSGGAVFWWNLTTAWDLSTQGPRQLTALDNFNKGLVFSSDGLSIISANNTQATKYDLSVAYAIEHGGPNLDWRIGGDSNIKAMKGIWRVSRSGGSGSTHYGLIGNTGTNIGAGDRTADFDPTTGYINYFDVRETNLPLSTEYGRIGFEKDNKGQDFNCADMLFQILHVPDPPATGAAPPRAFFQRKTIRHMITR